VRPTQGHRILTLILLLAVSGEGSAFAQSHDFPAPPPTSQSGWAASTAKLAAVLGAALLVGTETDEEVREGIQGVRGGLSNGVARIGNVAGTPQFAFGIATATLTAGALAGSPRLIDAGGHATIAVAAAGVSSHLLKLLIGRLRPSDNAEGDAFEPLTQRALHGSFPSGHATIAFALATVFAEETSDHWSDVAFYGAATLTGFSRLNDDRHWFADVLGGAALGWAVGRFVTRSHRSSGLVVGPDGLGFRLAF